jgi:3D (Asp-Asp-Asp) domain-containing protein
MTAYNAVAAQTDGDPMTTASGMRSNPQIIAARSLDLASELPFGTVIKVERTYADTPSCQYSKVAPQIGYRVIGDTMNARFSDTIDVLLDQKNTVPVDGRMVNPALAVGVCRTVKVTVVGHIDPKSVPATQEALEAMFAQPELAVR